MNIKELGLEELTTSEMKETKGGLAPIIYVGLVAAGLLVATFDAHAPGTGGGGGGMHP
ncbi:MAG: class IIb bacteriocin, lactobin A/cerein 7B family [Paludibacteraceae bacterium]|jgi:lactobin A/cerein 7B family class IIb bacteriocin|nr:class IIb bacteriocin, lactobin A/cerein 7B family [Paludibacteraceae bacterium]